MATDLKELAFRAVLYSLPLYEMARMRAATCPRRGPGGEFAAPERDSTLRWCNGFTHSRALLTPANREVVSPNNDTLYDNTWLDLADGPLVIDLPDMGERYWTLGFLDFWTNPFTGTSPLVKLYSYSSLRRRCQWLMSRRGEERERGTDCFSTDGLVAPARWPDVRTQMRTAQRGSIPIPWFSTIRVT
jgi:Protein of unknown function (DUF1254)